MSGTPISAPYLSFAYHAQGEVVQPSEICASASSQQRRYCNYFEVATSESTSEPSALFALSQIGYEDALARAWREFRKTAHAPENWDSYGSAKPNSVALANSRGLIASLTVSGLFPDFVQPSPEGGVTISFLRHARHAAIEMHNDGEAVAVISRIEGAPEVWEFLPGEAEEADAIERISCFVLG